MLHYVASDLGLYCLPMTFYGFPGKNGLTVTAKCYVCASLGEFGVTFDQIEGNL